jgi:TM2 domain-containing membrane protein YozV
MVTSGLPSLLILIFQEMTKMKIHVKAALLSALVLPGLGQLYKGERIKGVLLIVIVNIFIMVSLYMLIRNVAPLIVASQMNGALDTKLILERLHGGGPAVRLLLAAFCGLWMYSWIDAALVKKGKE